MPADVVENGHGHARRRPYERDPHEDVRRKTSAELSDLSSRLKALHDSNKQPRYKQQPASSSEAAGAIAVLSLRASIFAALKILKGPVGNGGPPAGSSWERR